MHVCMHIFFMHVSAYFRILSVILFQEETGLNPNTSKRCSGLHVLLSIYPHCSMCITYTDTTVSYHAGGLCTLSYVCSNTQTHTINTFYRLLKLYSLQTTNKTPDHDMTKELISFKTFLVFFWIAEEYLLNKNSLSNIQDSTLQLIDLF